MATTLLSIRFVGMCAFVSDNPRDISQTRTFVVVMPEVPQEPHQPILTFRSENYSSGGESAKAAVAPGEFMMGAWCIMKRELRITTPPTSTQLSTQGLRFLAGICPQVENLIIDPRVISDPLSMPVATLMEINDGLVFCDPNSVRSLGALEVQLLLELQGSEVRFQLSNFDHVFVEELILKPVADRPIQVAISNLSVPSFNSPIDHAEAYRYLLRNPCVTGVGLGCQPSRMFVG